jgi:hypothetical protein
MKPYLILLSKARSLLAAGRNLEVIEKEILEHPRFDENLAEDPYNKDLSAGQRLAFARKIIADAIDKEAKRLA